MGRTIFDYVGNLDTLLAVVVGAILATGGALVADVIRERAGRAQRERDAARFYGDILLSIDQVLDAAFVSQAVGDRWGAVTRRLFRAALNEAKVYERNREKLFEIQDMDLRFRIHEHFLRKLLPMIAVLEYSDEIAAVESTIANAHGLPEARSGSLQAELSGHKEGREAALAGILEERAKTGSVIRELEKLAKVTFVGVGSRQNASAPRSN